MHWLQGLNAVPTIRELHQHIETISNEELEKATRRLKAGDDPEQVIKSLARAISRKFSHKPVEGLNRDHSGQLADAARRLFDLKSGDDV
jgi:glutamyl-tRNA reductase